MFIEVLKSIRNSPSNLKKDFNRAIKTRDLNLFCSLFKHLSSEDLLMIKYFERLSVPIFSGQPVAITASFLQDVKDFMRDSGFSGTVAISDRTSTHVIASSNIETTEAPFSIHSIGKVFTQALLLRLIEEGIIPEEVLKQPIRLSPDVISQLPPEVQAQLSQTTLHDVMLHRGRYGDFLHNYTAAIEKALKEGSPIPQLNEPKDFLAYADKKLIKPDKLEQDGSSYSNLGLLLVGLSIEHLYNQYSEEKLDYQQILNRYILEPAGIRTFQTEMPEGAKINEADLIAPHIAGCPAGGYWTTAEDLLKFGKWLGEQCQNTSFMRLVDSYGGEFYHDREIEHGGMLASSSANLSHRIDNGLTIAIMSTNPDEQLGKAVKLTQDIQEHLVVPS